MSKKAGILYAILLFAAAIMIHLVAGENVSIRYEYVYIFIGLLVGFGALLILQLFLKKI
jgi:hypothetical protein